MLKKFKKIEEHITIGLIGNPNVGKSTLFNTLTGSHQHVGNWPGKTVEKKEGFFIYKNHKIKVVDLPGVYGLSAYTEEEIVSRDFIMHDQPDIIVQIIDTENLERNLYLSVQLIELGAPLIIALNRSTLAEKHDFFVNEKKLAELLGVSIVKIEAPKKEKVGNLLDLIFSQAHKIKKECKIKLTYGDEVNQETNKIKNILINNEISFPACNINWVALRLLEKDEHFIKKLKNKKYFSKLSLVIKKSRRRLKKIFDQSISSLLSEVRYSFIRGVGQEVIDQKNKEAKSSSDKIDRVLTDKFWGLIIFFLIMLLMFQLTFTLAAPLVEIINNLFDHLGEIISQKLALIEAATWINSLINNGLIGGTGTVLSFLPNIFILFLFIGLMEDTGYLARVAFVMDRFMHRIGLHGKSFIPLILGFGCNVPAIMATRTLRSKKDRLLTILINPLMSCSGRLPIYILFTAAFFSAYQGWVIFGLYILGVILAIVIGKIFNKLFFGGLSEPFVIELPSYHWPVLKGLLIHVWEKCWEFIKRAGSIILIFSVVIWLLASMPWGVEYAAQNSIIGKIGSVVSPLFKPLGFGGWQETVALFFGTAAKEVVVSTLGTLYGVAEESLTVVLKSNFTALSALSFMVFSLIYTPCLATIAVIKKETHSFKWALFVVAYSMALAWIVSFFIYQGGKLLGFT
ncbi:MAG: ferrous iron transport protein B [Patescibacteria group bacterium]|nr:ferrous iron transport protein B [Patescibacteria group bacterium]